MLALHCDNGFLHMYLPFFSATLKYAAETTRECDYEGQGTDRVSVEGLFFRFISHLCFFFFFVQYTHILNANCEGQSDSRAMDID